MSEGDLIPFDQTNLPAALGDFVDNSDLSSGVSGGFAVISMRGSKWRVKSAGVETPMMDGNGELMPSIRVVMLKASDHISKNYYRDGYEEGSNTPPDCFSTDGAKPDTSVDNPVSDNCVTCPYNQFGSRITDQGKKAKACSDSRRIALVPEGDFQNEEYGGPMLLRVPASSLSNLKSYAGAMNGRGYKYNTIVTRLSFDPDAAYPKVKFNAARALTPEEGNELVALLTDAEYRQQIDYILAADEASLAPKQEAIPAEAVFEDEMTLPPAPPVEEEPVVVEVKPQTKAKAAPKPEPEVVEAEVVEPEKPVTELDDDVDAILAKLDSLE